jgi:hypothetical protein
MNPDLSELDKEFYIMQSTEYWIPIPETIYSIKFLLCTLEAIGYVQL